MVLSGAQGLRLVYLALQVVAVYTIWGHIIHPNNLRSGIATYRGASEFTSIWSNIVSICVEIIIGLPSLWRSCDLLIVDRIFLP